MKTNKFDLKKLKSEVNKERGCVDLEQFKEQLKIVRENKDSQGNKFSSYGTLNAACWIGENSGCLIREIEILRQLCADLIGTVERAQGIHKPNVRWTKAEKE